jgi:hypothetical protein
MYNLIYIETGSYKAETVHSFNHLASKINCKNYMTTEIKTFVLSASNCLHGIKGLLKSYLLSNYYFTKY